MNAWPPRARPADRVRRGSFAHEVVSKRGNIGDDLRRVPDAGWSDSEIIEIVTHIALNTRTNCINIVAATEIDLPRPAAIDRSAVA